MIENTILKKVGILTLSHTDNKNYGAMLQSFALYTMIQNLGCKPYIINWKFKQKRTLTYNDISSESKIQYLYLCIRRFFGVKLGSVIQSISSLFGEKPFIIFSEFFLPNKTVRVTRENIAELNNEFENFIVGSDQVWRATSPDLYAFFLDFVNDSHRKISYAASFGIDQWNEATDEVTEEIRKLIKRFDSVSVRELSGVEICDSIFDVQAQFVLDPTLMLSINQYRPIFESESDEDLRDKDYIACMILDSKSSESICRSMNEKLSLPAISIRGKDITVFSLTFIRYNTVARWLNFIRHAQFVVTDSYHCVIFSILFKKRFAVIAHKKRGIARLESLLNLLNLKDRLFKDEDAFMNSKIWDQEIDFNRVEIILDCERQKSIEFITNSLK